MTDNENNQSKFEKWKKKYNENATSYGKDMSIARKIITLVVIVLLVVIGVGGFSAYQFISKGLSPVDPNNEETIQVTIPLGSSSSDIARILEENGVIANDLLYRFYVKFNNASNFQAGDYELSPSMTLAEITDELETGSIRAEPVFRVTVPEGRNIEEIASIYAENNVIEKEAFLEKMQDNEFIKTMMEKYPSLLTEEILHEDIRYPLEGYLFAATYEFYTDEPTIEEVIDQMLQKTHTVLTAHTDDIEGKEEFSLHEIITFASLVEEEASSAEDRKMISSVFYNRMDTGMRLQTDPTVIYAYGEHIPRLTYSHYEIESPYNTYHVDGLPVGPISNFGESSLTAVFEPEETDYLFFLADSEGNVYYSRTLKEHQAYEEQYIHNRD
ncbi:UPF0755 protein [Gracilibacillus halotolerans]|uniref:Endolytic murein transglycosylase n=1 Tax=Gracilibacillus halotolerans TaxID=74386 RepID=A0A841RGX1_9BACI|nr:UPF0755 protein [Gracilibacillus halotolerans]